MRRGLVASNERAHEVIAAGEVIVGGAQALNAGRLVGTGEPIRITGPPARFVSRGGEKLDAALDRFRIELRGTRVLDAGASTGGFTDCVLQRGAAEVIAVDVGHGQLHERLRRDPRVHVHERTNIRSLESASIGGPVDVVVADLSFISLRTALPTLLAASRLHGDLVLLVKPQFEARHAEASRGRGVIREPAVWRRTLIEVGGTLAQRGAAIMGVMVSPLRGAEGNVEFLVHAVAGGDAGAPEGLEALADQAVDAAVQAAANADGQSVVSAGRDPVAGQDGS